MTDLSRFVVSERRDPEMWDMYKKAVASFWTPEEIDLSQDMKDWEKLTDGERHFISHVLAFFAASDNIVCENLAARFYSEIQDPAAQAFYGFQIAMEQIHAETYQLLISTLVKDPAERAHLFAAVQTVPSVERKARWATTWMDPSRPLIERLVAFACVEGIFFSGSFAAIFYLKSRGLLPGLSFSNQLISRDEGLHCDFACMVLRKLFGGIEETPAVNALVDEAVSIELEFVQESLPVRLLGMNADTMSEYIRFVADVLRGNLGLAKAYHTANPFPFMEQISMQGKTNFFEARVGEYQKAGVLSGGHGEFSLEEDF